MCWRLDNFDIELRSKTQRDEEKNCLLGSLDRVVDVRERVCECLVGREESFAASVYAPFRYLF